MTGRQVAAAVAGWALLVLLATLLLAHIHGSAA